MKTNILILSFLALSGFLRAETTNVLFLTSNGPLYGKHSKQLQEAKKTKESLPADQFPEGNWGLVTNGFQLSLRFEKPSFNPGEPVAAIILLRNVTNAILTYRVTSQSDQDGPIQFVVSRSEET